MMGARCRPWRVSLDSAATQVRADTPVGARISFSSRSLRTVVDRLATSPCFAERPWALRHSFFLPLFFDKRPVDCVSLATLQASLVPFTLLAALVGGCAPNTSVPVLPAAAEALASVPWVACVVSANADDGETGPDWRVEPGYTFPLES